MARQLYHAHLSCTVNSRDFEGLTSKEFAISRIETKAATELLHHLVRPVGFVNNRPSR
jgi:hypothetical protein